MQNVTYGRTYVPVNNVGQKRTCEQCLAEDEEPEVETQKKKEKKKKKSSNKS